MSFKHDKFDASPVMRSLEKLAISKGMMKPEVVVKQASSIKDLTPTSDFTQNLLKLCSGLRSSGFEKQADELEVKYLQFKQAGVDIYNTSKETGEDLVDFAHPKGSHKLDGVDGDAVVETIVEQKAIIEKIVGKTPTGKLASKDIINLVKVALAEEDQFSKESLNKKIDYHVDLLRKYLNEALNQSRAIGGKANEQIMSLVYEYIRTRETSNLLTAKRKLKDLIKELDPGYFKGFLGGVYPEQWTFMKPMFDEATKSLDEIIMAAERLEKITNQDKINSLKDKISPAPTLSSPTAVPAPNGTPTTSQKPIQDNSLVDKINEGLSIVNSYLNYIGKVPDLDEEDKATGKKILNDIKSKIEAASVKYTALKDKSISEPEVDAQIKRLDNFKKKWFKSNGS